MFVMLIYSMNDASRYKLLYIININMKNLTLLNGCKELTIS